MTRTGCGPRRRRVIWTVEVAQAAAIAASISHGGEHTIEKCGGHWHVRRVTS